MNIKSATFILLLLATGSRLNAAVPPVSDETTGYLQVSVDNLVINTDGVIDASQSLTRSIDRLSVSIEQLALKGSALNESDKAALIGAVKSVDRASVAVARLARELPQTAQQLSAQLPQIVTQAHAPITEISTGLESVRQSIIAITEALPEASENAKQLVASALDTALIKLSIYSALLLGLIALAVIAVFWFVYRQYLRPLIQQLDALTGAPEHFASLSRHMRDTSANLLRLEREGGRRPAVGRMRAQ